MRVFLIASLADSLINFRGHLIASFQAKGHEVHVAAPDLPSNSFLRLKLEGMGMLVHSITLDRTGTSPSADARTLFDLWRLMRCIRPDVVLGYTIKPVIYGTLAAWLADVPQRYAMVTGLGYSFQAENQGSQLQVFVLSLYRLALSKVHKVFFQNPDNKALFLQRGLLRRSTPSCVLNGSGVDLSYFAQVPLPCRPARFLLIARLIGAKGVREYAEAAQRVRARYPDIKFSLVGWIDKNPDAIKQFELDAWVAAGAVDYIGQLADVRPAVADCSVFVLPTSYPEGTPRTVLEAMAMGRPIITTDAPGCRETVVDGDNGFLIPVKSVDALEHAMLRFIEDPTLLPRMGKRSRQIAEDKYDVHKVNAVMLREMGVQ